jgi:PPM family protein phosphatase
VKSEDIMTELPVFAFGQTDVGGRKTNEDAFHMAEQHESSIATRGRLYVVADGTGGQDGGRTASAWAAEVVAENYYDNTSDDLGESLRTAIRSAHQALFRLAEEVTSWRSMSTTLVALIVKGNQYWVAHVGDSRLYLVREDKVQQLTQDHTWQEDDDNAGSLTRWLGGGDKPTVEIELQHGTLKDGDVLILCTDGLYNYVSKDDMRDLMRRMGVKPAVQQMIAFAKTHGTSDNATAIAVRLGGSVIEAAPQRRQMMFVGGGVAAALILIVALISLANNRPTPPIKVTPTEETGALITATPVADTPVPGAPTSTLRPTDIATATSAPLPTTISTPAATSGAVSPTVVPTPLCAGYWDPVMNRCRLTDGEDPGPRPDPGPR